MHIGICLPNYGRASSPEAIREVAQAAESLGFDSLWTTDHILVPEAHYEPYGRIFETWTTLAYVAALTQRVRLGTSILLLGLRNPVLVAKQAATLDQLSNGRLILGIGAGWLAPEFENLGMSFRRRVRFLEEGIALMRTLWTNPRPRFQGRFFRIQDAVFEPLPVQPGGPPIWIGGNTEAAVRRAARLGDGWHPVGLDPETLRTRVAQLRTWSGAFDPGHLPDVYRPGFPASAGVYFASRRTPNAVDWPRGADRAGSTGASGRRSGRGDLHV